MILSGKADDADGLTPFKEENAAWRNQTMYIFKSFRCYKVVGVCVPDNPWIYNKSQIEYIP